MSWTFFARLHIRIIREVEIFDHSNIPAIRKMPKFNYSNARISRKDKLFVYCITWIIRKTGVFGCSNIRIIRRVLKFDYSNNRSSGRKIEYILHTVFDIHTFSQKHVIIKFLFFSCTSAIFDSNIQQWDRMLRSVRFSDWKIEWVYFSFVLRNYKRKLVTEANSYRRRNWSSTILKKSRKESWVVYLDHLYLKRTFFLDALWNFLEWVNFVSK